MAEPKLAIRFLNRDEFLSKIKPRLTGGALQTYKKISAETALELQKLTRIDAPVKTGFLRRSYELFFDEDGAAAGVMTQCEYAPKIEFSHKPHFFHNFEKLKGPFMKKVREAFKHMVNG